ncbi:MAG: hypothetical protein LH606_02715 [Cytophagaceae bacterium]|nr:hypothetical protein [Cytophagaceae bacterium]
MNHQHSSEENKLSGNALIAVFLFLATVLWFFGDLLTFTFGVILIGAAFAAYYNAEHTHDVG